MAEFDEMFIFLEPGADPAADRAVRVHSGSRTLFVWVPDGASAARVAAEQAGVRLIELYRGFNLESTAQVIEAVRGRAPVGVAWQEFGARPATGRIGNSATIYEDPEPVDPVAKIHKRGGRTTIVAASDASKAAVELVEEGVELIEICGGTPLTTARAVQVAIDGRVPVSYVSYSFESIEGVAAYKASFAA